MALSSTRRWWLLAEMVVLGLPATVVLVVMMGALVFMIFFFKPGLGMGADYPAGTSLNSAIWILLVLIGLACLTSLWRIAIAAFLGRSLREIGMSWWLMLKTGMLLAILFGTIMLIDLNSMTPGKLLEFFLAGPALLIPATHLLIERRSS